MSFSNGIPGNDSDIQVPPREPERTPGYVKNKIKAHKSHKRASQASRAWKRKTRAIVARAKEKLALVIKEFGDEHLDKALRTLVKQLDATKLCWDLSTKPPTRIREPDEKIRQDAALAILAYKLGRPIEKSQSMAIHGTTEDFKQLLESIKRSPGALKAIPPALLDKAQSLVTDEAAGAAPDQGR